MSNFVLRYGIISGCISIALGLINWFFVAQPFGADSSQVVGYLSIVIALLCVPVGIKYYRDKLNNGVITFGRGFTIGIGITLINAIVSFLYSVTFFVIEGENFQEWREQAMTPAELEAFRAQLAGMPDFATGPLFQGLIVFVMVLLVGLIINVISSLSLTKSVLSTH